MQLRFLRAVSSFLNWLISTISVYIDKLTRPLVKWVLRRTTGLCELQRTCYCEPIGAPRVLGVENSLKRSRHVEVKKLLEFLDRAAVERRFSSPSSSTVVKNTVQAICSIKTIKPSVHQPFSKSFGDCITVIWGYNELIHELESIRTTAYDSLNTEHEKKLLELWSLLMPERHLDARVSNYWKDLGFQGDDPKTDFRGMGILGLENLLHFAKNYPEAATHVLSHSIHPKHGYSFAIVGINLTHLALTLWREGSAKTHVYNLCCQPTPAAGRPSLLHFHRFYCYLFFEFDKLWLLERPPTIMEFSRIRALFEKSIRAQLTDPHCLFKLNFPVEHI